jgi:hypothetical protein
MIGSRDRALCARSRLPPLNARHCHSERSEESIFELKHIFDKNDFMKPHNYIVEEFVFGN